MPFCVAFVRLSLTLSFPNSASRAFVRLSQTILAVGFHFSSKRWMNIFISRVTFARWSQTILAVGFHFSSKHWMNIFISRVALVRLSQTILAVGFHFSSKRWMNISYHASCLCVCLRPFHFLIAPLQLDFHFSSKYPFRLRVLCIPVSVFWVFYFKHINSKII